MANTTDKKEIFERMPVPKALAVMAVPTVISQLITLVYNLADTWFIGRTGDPYKVAACSLVATVFFLTNVVSNLLGTGGGTRVTRLLGKGDDDEARNVASYSFVFSGAFAVVFSLACLIFMNPLLRLLGASDNTIAYARQYMIFVVVIGGVPTVLSTTMSTMLRNIGYSKNAAFGLGLGGVLNVILDPLFMFVILPDGLEVAGAAIATMLSNIVAFVYYITVYRKVSATSVLAIPKKLPRITKASSKEVYAIGIPAAITTMLYDLCNMTINKLSAMNGDLELAAMGLVLKVERLPLNIGIGLCLAMIPLIAYNYSSGNKKRMQSFFNATRITGLCITAVSIVLYRLFGGAVMRLFIDDAETVRLGTEFIKIRCFITPAMFLCFNMVYFMSAIGRAKSALALPVIRQLVFNIPILIIANHFFAMQGVVLGPIIADVLTVIASYIIYFKVKREIM